MTFAFFALALAVRLLNLFLIAGNPYFTAPIMDEQYHHLWAVDILRDRWSEYLPFYRAPGYPYLLAAAYGIAGTEILVGRVLSSILGALTVATAFVVGTRTVGMIAAIIGAVVLTFYPMALYFDGMLVGAALETLLFTLSLLALLEAGTSPPGRRSNAYAIAVGGLLGLATITRPIMGVLLPLAIALSLARRPRRWRPAILAGLVFLIPIALVTAINIVLGGDKVLVAWNGGINFFLGNNPSASGWSATAPELRPSWWLGYLDAIQIASRNLGHEASPSEVSAYWYQRGWEFVTGAPLAWLKLMIKKCYLMLSSFEFSNNQSIQGFFTYSPLFRVPFLSFATVLPLAAPQFIRREFWRGPLAWFLVVYGATVVVFFVTSRYRMPLIPLLVLLAAKTVVECVQEIRRREWSALGFRFAMPAAVAAIITTSDLANARDPDIAEHHYSQGNRFAEAGAFDQAIAEYEIAIRDRPYHMGAWNNIGTVRLRQGKLPEARRVLEQSLALEPTADAYARIGLTYFQEGNLDSARAALQRSLTLTGDNPEALYYLGSVAAAQGNIDEAIANWERALGLHADPSIREHLWYALGKAYARNKKDPVRAAEYLGRVTKQFPDLEELRDLVRSK